MQVHLGNTLLLTGTQLLMVLQVARAVSQMLSDEEGVPEQMVAILDAQQATTLQVTRKVNLIKRLAHALNQVTHTPQFCAFPRMAVDLPLI